MSKLAVANIIFETTEANRIEYTGNNVVRVRANGGLQIPYGTTAQRVSPEYGIIRYNTDLQTVEMYDAGGWYNMPTGGYVNSIYTVANSAYAAANNVGPQIAPTFNTANAAYNQANLGYTSSNVVYAAVNSAFATINADYAFTNSAYASINSNWTVTNTVYGVANAAYGAANNVGPQIAPAYNTANAAFAAANTKFSSSGGTISGAVEITADLTVHGNTRFVDQQTLQVGDPLIYLAANNYASDVVDIGFVANYVNATSSNVHTGLFRSSGTKEYYLFQGYDKEPLNNYIDPTGNNITMAVLNSTVRTSNLILGGANTINWITSAYASINSNWTVTNTAYSVSNAAFGLANTALQNTSSLFAGNLSIKNGYLIRPLYTSDNSYSATFGWAWLQLGNNAWNDFVAGNTVGGGYFRWYVNNTADMTSAGASNGTLAMILGSTGNLGIGVNPSYPLEIGNSNSVSLVWQRTGVAAKKWGFNSDNSATYLLNVTDNFYGLAITNTAKLGVGNYNPNTKLDIANTHAAGITMRYDGTETYRAMITPYWNNSTDSRIDFGINAAGGITPIALLSVGYANNVGIATTSPAYSLDMGSRTDGLRLPVGTTAQRPTGATGVIRFNSTSGFPEWYDTNAVSWRKFSENSYLLEIIIVAGGGGGGYDLGGGGGAGGLIYSSSVSVTAGVPYTVTIGGGGTYSTATNVNGTNGGNSSAFDLTAIGGGGGGSYNAPTAGSSGGSGGGGGSTTGSGYVSGGSGTSGQGNAGGSGYRGVSDGSYGITGGGGGAGAAGNNGDNANGKGGNGLQYSQFSSWGSPAGWFAGGGGGSSDSSGAIGAGGSGGGGTGGQNGGSNGNGVTNTGGGAGGAGLGNAGTGGSGIVLIRYIGTQRGTGGTVSSSGGYTYHAFTTSGTFTA